MQNEVNIILETVSKLSQTSLQDSEWKVKDLDPVMQFSYGPIHDITFGKKYFEDVPSLEAFRRKLYSSFDLDYVSVDKVVETKEKEKEGLIDPEDAEMIYFTSGLTINDDLVVNFRENSVIPDVVAKSAKKKVERRSELKGLKKTL